MSLVSTGQRILATMDTPCRRVDRRHHLMVRRLLAVLNMLQCVDVPCVHIEERVCAEIDMLWFTAPPLVKGSI